MGISQLTGVLLNAGSGFISGGPKGAAVAAGLTVGSIILEKLKTSDNDSLAAQNRKRIIKAPVVSPNYVFGVTKISGAQCHYSKRVYMRGESKYDDVGSTVDWPFAIQRRILSLSETGFNKIRAVYIDGRLMPFDVSSQDVITPDLSAWNAQIETLRARYAALNLNVPKFLRDSLNLQIAKFVDSRDNIKWLHNVNIDRGGEDLFVPNVRITTDLNADKTVSAADLRAQLVLGDEFENWNGSPENLQYLSWILVELRSFKPYVESNKKDRSISGPSDSPTWPSNEPNVQLVVENNDLDTPAAVAEHLLKNVYEFTDNDLENVQQAKDICDEKIEIQLVTLASPANVLNPVLQTLYPEAIDNSGNLDPNLLPSASDQEKALVEWNNKYAGPNNAQKRFQCNGSITGRMLENPQQLLNRLGAAMNGWIIPNGSKFKFVVGHNTPPVMTIDESEIYSEESADVESGLVTFHFGPGLEKRYSAVRGELTQDINNEFDKSNLPPVINHNLVSQDGYREENLGALPFQNNEISARRLLTKYSRRTNPDLNRLLFNVNKGDETWKNYRLSAGDRVTLNFPSEDVVNEIYRIISIQPTQIDGILRIDCVEDPDDIYDDDFDPVVEGLTSERYAPVNLPDEVGGLEVSATYAWRTIEQDDGSLRYALDLILLVGSRVKSLRISGRLTVGDYTLTSDYTLAIQPDQRETRFIHTFQEDAGNIFKTPWDFESLSTLSISLRAHADLGGTSAERSDLFRLLIRNSQLPKLETARDLQRTELQPGQSLRYKGGSGLDKFIAAQNVEIRSSVPDDFSEFLDNTLIAIVDDDTVEPNPVNPDPTLPLPGTAIFTGLSLDDNDATVKIAAPTSGGAVGSYEIQRSTSSSFSNAVSTIVLDVGDHVFNDLNVGTHYFRIRARNATGNGAWSNVRSVTIAPALSAPGVPGLSLSLSNIRNIVAKITAPVSGGAVATYEIQIDTDVNFGSPETRVLTGTEDVSFNNLPYSITHYVRLRAINSAGRSSYVTKSLRTGAQPLALPGTPSIALSVSENSIRVAVTPPTSGGAVASYEYQIARNSVFNIGLQTATAASAVRTFSGLSYDTTYYVRVRAKNASGNGAYSTPKSINIPVQVRSVTFNIGAPTDLRNTRVEWNSSDGLSLTLPAALMLDNQSESVREIYVRRSTDGEGWFLLNLPRSNDRLVSTWENNNLATRFNIGGEILDLPGPNNSAWTTRDSSEPYINYVRSGLTLANNIDSFIVAVNRLSSSQRRNASVTFYY